MSGSTGNTQALSGTNWASGQPQTYGGPTSAAQTGYFPQYTTAASSSSLPWYLQTGNAGPQASVWPGFNWSTGYQPPPPQPQTQVGTNTTGEQTNLATSSPLPVAQGPSSTPGVPVNATGEATNLSSEGGGFSNSPSFGVSNGPAQGGQFGAFGSGLIGGGNLLGQAISAGMNAANIPNPSINFGIAGSPSLGGILGGIGGSFLGPIGSALNTGLGAISGGIQGVLGQNALNASNNQALFDAMMAGNTGFSEVPGMNVPFSVFAGNSTDPAQIANNITGAYEAGLISGPQASQAFQNLNNFTSTGNSVAGSPNMGFNPSFSDIQASLGFNPGSTFSPNFATGVGTGNPSTNSTNFGATPQVDPFGAPVNVVSSSTTRSGLGDEGAPPPGPPAPAPTGDANTGIGTPGEPGGPAGPGSGDSGGSATGTGGGVMRRGGLVKGGNPKSKEDDVPAKLQHGEFVEPREATKRFGPQLEAMRQSALQAEHTKQLPSDLQERLAQEPPANQAKIHQYLAAVLGPTVGMHPTGVAYRRNHVINELSNHFGMNPVAPPQGGVNGSRGEAEI